MEVKYDALLGKMREKDGGGGASYGPDVSRYSGHYIGEIIKWPAATPPAHCLICDGSLVSRTTYAALFAVIGETYGAGDGETTFALPESRGRFLEGVPEGGAVGTAVEAGLPEIAGRFGSAWPRAAEGASGQVQPSGALSGGTSAGAVTLATQASGVPYANAFAASASDSIFGNSPTVQPPALTMLFVIVAE